MKEDEESQIPQITPTGSNGNISSPSFSIKKYGHGLEGLFGRGRYKIWALAAILLLALWTMFTGALTLKSSVANLKHTSNGLIHADLDILDVDEREKMVKQMWNVYKHNSAVRLPKFWRDAFGAAFQDLSSEVADVRNAALREIAKMSLQSRDVYEANGLHSASRESEEARRGKLGKTRKLK